MRYMLLTCALTAVCLPAQANTVTHGGYSATDQVAFQWTELTSGYSAPIQGATRVLGNHDDSATTAIDLGFNFVFFGQQYSQAYISSNGLVSFGGGLTSNNNTYNYNLGDYMNISTRPMVAAAWDDWTTSFSGTDGVYYATVGTPGNRAFVVEWHNTKKYDTASNSNSSPVTFEVVLFEGSNAIQLNYLDMETGGSLVNPDASRGATATTGIRDVDAYSNGRYLQWSHDQPVLLSNSSVLITPVPEPETYALMLAGLGLVGYAARRRSISAL